MPIQFSNLPTSRDMHPSSSAGRSRFQKIAQRIGALRSSLFHSPLLPASRAWRGAIYGLALTAALVWAALSLAGFALAGAAAGILGWLGGILAAAILAALLILLARLLGRLPAFYAWVFLTALPLMLIAYMAVPLAYGMVAVVFLLLVGASTLGAGIAQLAAWPRLTQRQKVTRAAVPSLLGLLLLTVNGAVLLPEGRTITPPVNAAAVSAQAVKPLELSDPSLPGPFAVQTLTYGSGTDLRRPQYAAQADLKTEPVDGSALVEGWSGLRTAYWGFGPQAMPLNARVWLPQGPGPYPLILLVHGNHPMEDPSEDGYAYLAELLASRGFITASIDENFLNLSLTADLAFLAPLKEENDARAWLILQHLHQWQQWSITPGNPFYGLVNMDSIGLVGHSRGGEAVALAAAFNRMRCHPDDASIPLGGGFNIRAVAAVAPVDGQFRPGGRHVLLSNINYLVLHGAQDMDVATFSGSRTYQQLFYDDGKLYFKTALYIYGANHGQFNRAWGRRDMLGPARQLFNLTQLMPAAEQEKIAQVAVSAFFEASLHQQSGYRALFQDPRSAAAWFPPTILLSQYQDSATLRAATFEEDLDLTSASWPNALRGENLTRWQEKIVPLKWGNLETSAVLLGWDHNAKSGTPRYILSLPPQDLSLQPHTYLTFSLAASDESPLPHVSRPTQPLTQPMDASLELADHAGQTARLPLSHFSLLQPPLRTHLGKMDWMSFLPLSEPVFQTFEYSLGDFSAQNPALNLASLTEVRFIFDRTPAGVIFLDEIGFRP